MRFSELADRRVGVWGVAREAASFARRLAELVPTARLAVVATDEPADPEAVAPFVAAGAAPVHGDAILPALLACDVVVRSPGVSVYRDELTALRAAGVHVGTATGLWLAEPHAAPVVGVTGTKGKSTTATLIAHLLRAAGRDVELAGNVGRPALELLGEPVPDVYVLELSSYQVADLDTGPDLAVLTNLYREHLDWHRSEERYRADKLRIVDLAVGRGGRVQRRRPGPGAARRAARQLRLRHGGRLQRDGRRRVRRRRARAGGRARAPARDAQPAQPVRRARDAAARSARTPATSRPRWPASAACPTGSRWSASATGCCGSTTASRPRPSPRWRPSARSPSGRSC